MLEYDKAMQAKEIEIASLHAQLATARTAGNRRVDSAADIETTQLEPINETSDTLTSRRLETSTAQFSQKGKAPPVDLFTGESDVLWEDWLPTLERTATGNNWTENEKLLQLTGHLRGKAAQEWVLLSTAEKSTFAIATTALGSRLDRGGKTLAAQEFRHTVQQSVEAVLDFVLKLEQTFRRAYGRENMSAETRDTLLYGQLQEGLKYTLVKSSAVSRARNYTELCLAARNEERRLTELYRRQQYQQQDPSSNSTPSRRCNNKVPQERGMANKPNSGQSLPRGMITSGDKAKNKRCWKCDKPGHAAKDCRTPNRESVGQTDGQTKTKMVKVIEMTIRYIIFCQTHLIQKVHQKSSRFGWWIKVAIPSMPE